MPNYIEVRVKPAVKRNNIYQEVIAVSPEYAKVGLKIDVEGTTTTVVEVITQ